MSFRTLRIGGWRYGISVNCDTCKTRAWYIDNFYRIRINKQYSNKKLPYDCFVKDFIPYRLSWYSKETKESKSYTKHICKYCNKVKK